MWLFSRSERTLTVIHCYQHQYFSIDLDVELLYLCVIVHLSQQLLLEQVF